MAFLKLLLINGGYFILTKKRRKPDYAYKSYILKNYSSLLQDMKTASYIDFCNRQFYLNGELKPFFEPSKGLTDYYWSIFRDCKENCLESVFYECERINKATFNRVVRLKKRITEMMLDGQCLFATLTFTDDCLNRSSVEDRRRYVQRYLKSLGCRYVANIDYGGKNGREHYHAIIRIDKINLGKDNYWTRNYGNINIEKVRIKNASPSKSLAKYISKLTNHAIKESTKRSCYIYSR